MPNNLEMKKWIEFQCRICYKSIPSKFISALIRKYMNEKILSLARTCTVYAYTQNTRQLLSINTINLFQNAPFGNFKFT